MLTPCTLGQGTTNAPNSVGGNDRLYQGGEPSIKNFTISVERMCRYAISENSLPARSSIFREGLTHFAGVFFSSSGDVSYTPELKKKTVLHASTGG